MTVAEISEKLGLKVYTAKDAIFEKNAKGCYIGDLLSHAMAKVEAENAWITIQTNINIVAVATLADASCIIIADGFQPDENAIIKADEENIIIMGTDFSAYDIAAKLAALGI